MVGSSKDGLWVNYYLAVGVSSPYSAVLLGNLKHWLNDDPEIVTLMTILLDIRREDICK